MSPKTRFILDIICWYGTAMLLMTWGHTGWAFVVGAVGSLYLAFCFTLLQRWKKMDDNDEVHYD